MTEKSYSYKEPRRALFYLLKEYINPALADDCIIYGNQQNIILPPEGNDYLIFYINRVIRHGTDRESYDPINEVLTLKEHSELIAQVDCYADSRNTEEEDPLLCAQIRAHNLELLFRSSVACRFLRPYGIAPLYADACQDTTIISDSNQYLHRWTTYLHLGMTTSYTISEPSFNAMKVIPNSLVTQAQADADTDLVLHGKMHVSDVDVKFPD